MKLSKSLRVIAALLAVLMSVTVATACNDSEETDTTVTTTTAPTTTTTTPTTAVNGVMDDELTVRDGPGFSHNAIGGVAKGEPITIVGHEGDWFKIRFGDGFGYVNAHYVAVEGQPNASQMQASRPVMTTTTAVSNTGVIKADTVTVYPSPDASGDSIGELPKDSQVIIISREEEFYQIQFGTGIGFVPADKVEVKVTTTSLADGTTGSGAITTTTGKNAIPDTQAADPLA